MGGDYGQCLPIVENKSQATQFRMQLKTSDLWNEFKQYKLKKMKYVQIKTGENYCWR